ncbi:hypothetical protein P8452_42245 [Trifolium repens]|nr:hypothetical protein P8452_42245 [Trifolium repens]
MVEFQNLHAYTTAKLKMKKLKHIGSNNAGILFHQLHCKWKQVLHLKVVIRRTNAMKHHIKGEHTLVTTTTFFLEMTTLKVTIWVFNFTNSSNFSIIVGRSLVLGNDTNWQ